MIFVLKSSYLDSVPIKAFIRPGVGNMIGIEDLEAVRSGSHDEKCTLAKRQSDVRDEGDKSFEI